METQREEKRLNRIDVLNLKKRGLSNEKISKMADISIHRVDQFIKCQKQIKELSGVF